MGVPRPRRSLERLLVFEPAQADEARRELHDILECRKVFHSGTVMAPAEIELLAFPTDRDNLVIEGIALRHHSHMVAECRNDEETHAVELPHLWPVFGDHRTSSDHARHAVADIAPPSQTS